MRGIFDSKIESLKQPKQVSPMTLEGSSFGRGGVGAWSVSKPTMIRGSSPAKPKPKPIHPMNVIPGIPGASNKMGILTTRPAVLDDMPDTPIVVEQITIESRPREKSVRRRSRRGRRSQRMQRQRMRNRWRRRRFMGDEGDEDDEYVQCVGYLAKDMHDAGMDDMTVGEISTVCKAQEMAFGQSYHDDARNYCQNVRYC